MKWITINIGKYKDHSLTIPQIATKDWNYFDWMYKNECFKGDLRTQADLAHHNMKYLRLPPAIRNTHCVQFLYDASGKLSDVRVTDLRHVPATPARNEVRSQTLNLAWKTDGIGQKLIKNALKKHWLNGKSLTKARLEELLSEPRSN